MIFVDEVQYFVKVSFSWMLVIKAALTRGKITLKKEAMYQAILDLIRTWLMKKSIKARIRFIDFLCDVLQLLIR